jgi:hypothetical protein
MDSNKLRVEEHRATIARNISGSTANPEEVIAKGEKISIVEFQDRLKKGESFLSQSQVDRFIKDTHQKAVSAFDPETKEQIIKAVENELNLLKGVTVVNEIGQEFNFFTKSEEVK